MPTGRSEELDFRAPERSQHDDQAGNEEPYDGFAAYRSGLAPEDQPNGSPEDQPGDRNQDRPAEDPEVTRQKELSRALETRQQPYAKDLAEIRESIKTGKAFEELAKQSTFNNPYNTVEVDGPNGKKLLVSDTGRKGVYVVREGDSTYILNQDRPTLDSKFAAGAPAGKDSNWSQDKQSRKEYNSMLIHASLSLGQQADSLRGAPREQALRSVQSMYEGAHKEGLVSDKQLADELGYLGFRYSNELKDFGKGLALSERALSLMEKTVGNSAADTINQRMHLISDYLQAGKPASADSLLKKQTAAMLDAEKDGRGLDQAIALERGMLVQQLNQRDKKDEANKIQDRALDLLMKNPDGLDLHGAGMVNTRRQLIEHYKEQKKPENVSKLYDQEIKALKQLQASEPTSYRIPQMRNGLISDLANMKDHERLKPLLEEKREELNDIETYPTHQVDWLRNTRITLAQRYLQVGNAERASETGKQVFDSANKDMKSADSATIQQRLELQSKLAGLEGKKEFNDFSGKTIEMFREFEKKDKVDQAEVSQIRRLLIEQAESRKDGKAMAGFLEDELKSLESKQPKNESAIADCKQSIGDAMVMQGKNKEAATIYEKLAKEAVRDRDKVEPLEKLADVLEQLGRKAEAETARKDAKAIRKGLPPETYRSPNMLVR
ncbi:MAG: hypothetical protein K2W95_05975 [Candidatus Obscuribacterales bacterium]|nr:hypothetical protein [Candidatus Obscuribacterales bacterium]